MKRLPVVPLFAVTLIMFVPLVLTAQTTVAHFNQDGSFASLNESLDAFNSFSLSVSENFATSSGSSASIGYTSLSIAQDFSTLTFTQIFGAIPATDFSGANTQNLALNFSTSDLDPTNSFSQTCTVDLNTLTLTCSPVAPGTISLSFSGNGASRTRVLALGEEITVGNITTRIHQRSDNTSANASGTVCGTSVSASNATIGVNHSTTMEVIKN